MTSVEQIGSTKFKDEQGNVRVLYYILSFFPTPQAALETYLATDFAQDPESAAADIIPGIVCVAPETGLDDPDILQRIAA